MDGANDITVTAVMPKTPPVSGVAERSLNAGNGDSGKPLSKKLNLIQQKTLFGDLLRVDNLSLQFCGAGSRKDYHYAVPKAVSSF